jgi:hypothetical protein
MTRAPKAWGALANAPGLEARLGKTYHQKRALQQAIAHLELPYAHPAG